MQFKQTRRHFLRQLATLTVAGFPLASSALAAKPNARSLAFDHTHTGKHLDIVYAVGNTYIPEALTTLNYFLRDHYTGEIGRMDPKLFDQLFNLTRTLQSGQPFQVISGYRCPATNSRLRKTGGGGVASHSLHMVGKAIDIRLPGVALNDLRDAALHSRAGGVGFYPKEQFVHVDTGPVRRW